MHPQDQNDLTSHRLVERAAFPSDRVAELLDVLLASISTISEGETVHSVVISGSEECTWAESAGTLSSLSQLPDSDTSVIDDSCAWRGRNGRRG